jgi:hypothetical protein
MAVSSGPYCSALGCGDDARVVVRLDDARERVVCDDHSDDGEVIGDV